MARRTLAPEVAELRSTQCIRERCENVLKAALAGRSRGFEVRLEKLDDAARLTAEVTRERYPDLRVPPHSRFGHFDAGDVPRTAALEHRLAELDVRERARRLCELVVVSVLVDAGAGSRWSYQDRQGPALGRSEGLAVASLRWAETGGLSLGDNAFRVDAARLTKLTADELRQAFQVSSDNPLVGVEGRIALLNALGRATTDHPDLFPGARVGGLIDSLWEHAVEGRVTATRVLSSVLEGLGDIWPGRLSLSGVSLGDVWPHPAAGGQGASAGLVPFHKLSQWLTYSLLHPLQVAGLKITDLDALTGLAEYRNGGLLIDAGVLVPKHAEALDQVHAATSELVVEWRALTVALLDRMLAPVRAELGVAPEDFPLAAMLEGGTWMAGRRLARERRADGAPPLRIDSDGTVF